MHFSASNAVALITNLNQLSEKIAIKIGFN